jgi:hypothetical protein
MSPARLAAACFLLGGGLLFLSESLVPQLAGVILLLTSIVIGAFAIASPEFLAGREGDS